MKRITQTTRILFLFWVISVAVDVGRPEFLTASETTWSPTEARVVYTGPAYSHKQRYNVLPSVVRLPEGSLVALVEPKKLVFIRSKDGGKSWSEPYVGVSPKEEGTLSALGVRRNGGLNWYANMLWSVDDPDADWGYYTSVEVVDENTAVVLIKETPAPNIIRACLLRRQP